MTLTIDVSAELDARLHAEAARQGMDAGDYARKILEEKLLATGEQSFWKTATREEWLRAFHTWVGSHDPTLPPLPDGAFRRESFYGERG